MLYKDFDESASTDVSSDCAFLATEAYSVAEVVPEVEDEAVEEAVEVLEVLPAALA